MKRIVTKTNFSVTIDRNIKETINEEIINKSKYIESLIYQDLKQNSKNEKIQKLFI